MARFREDVYSRFPEMGYDLDWELLADHVTVDRMHRQQWATDVRTARASHR